MRLKSSSFSDGAVIPRRFTCDGDDESPHLEWSGAPTETRSFVVLCEDPDAPRGTWRHWAAYDIPAHQQALASGAAQDAERQGFKQAINDFKRPGYGGPCPPPGHGPHHYHFRVLALSTDHLPVKGSPHCSDVEVAAQQQVLAEARLIGIYER